MLVSRLSLKLAPNILFPFRSTYNLIQKFIKTTLMYRYRNLSVLGWIRVKSRIRNFRVVNSIQTGRDAPDIRPAGYPAG
jgi:hypothetical protein